MTYTLTYKQQNVAGSFADTGDDEFYWDTNGTGFDQPFARVSARVHIDPSITTALTGNTACYQGAEKSTTKCSITRSEDGSTTPAGSVFAASANDLKANETMTLAVGFVAGTFIQEPVTDTGSGGGTGNSTGDYGGNAPSRPSGRTSSVASCSFSASAPGSSRWCAASHSGSATPAGAASSSRNTASPRALI